MKKKKAKKLEKAIRKHMQTFPAESAGKLRADLYAAHLTIEELNKKLQKANSYIKGFQVAIKKMKEQSALDHDFATKIKAENISLRGELAHKKGFNACGSCS